MALQRRKWLVPSNSKKPLEEYTRDEILWVLRTRLEGDHRHETHFYSVRHKYTPSLKDIDHLPEMEITDFLDTCNKSVAVYNLRGPICFGQVLHNYIYRRWFHPYQSEIECQRFICKFITPRDVPLEFFSPSQTTINSIVSLNSAICAEVKARRRAYEEQLASGDERTRESLSEVQNLGLHILQPLFQALLIIADSEYYHKEDSKTVGRVPVFLVRTGIEDGLSAPITFESIADKIDGHTGEARSAIKTTLETAIDFVISLEAREAAAFGLQPDPVAAWEPFARNVSHEWKEILGAELLIGPSSKFVDIEKHPEWTGSGEDYDSRIMADFERLSYRRC